MPAIRTTAQVTTISNTLASNKYGNKTNRPSLLSSQTWIGHIPPLHPRLLNQSEIFQHSLLNKKLFNNKVGFSQLFNTSNFVELHK